MIYFFFSKPAAKYLAPATPKLLWLTSRTSIILFLSNIEARILAPSFPNLFLERFNILILLAKLGLVGSKAKARISASATTSPAVANCTFVSLGDLANNCTKGGSSGLYCFFQD